MHLVPFTKSAEWTIPGKFLYYATAMPRRTGAIPLIATTVDGRPIKLEGNPLHPASAGTTDTFAQASVLDLYDPARSQRFVNRGKDSNRAEFDASIDKLRGQLGSSGGDGLAFLVEEVHSPTRERLRADLEKAFPKLTWCVYDAGLSEEQNYATGTSFGENVRLIPRFDRADVVLALDSDFLDCGEGDVAGARAFTQRPPRKIGRRHDEPTLCCGEPVHHYWRNGRSSPALSCQPDSSLHLSARRQDRRCNQRRRAIFASLHTGRAR